MKNEFLEGKWLSCDLLGGEKKRERQGKALDQDRSFSFSFSLDTATGDETQESMIGSEL